MITERGRPVARSVPIRERKGELTVEQALKEMEEEGLLIPASRPGPMADFKPIKLRGKPISETISEDREDRF